MTEEDLNRHTAEIMEKVFKAMNAPQEYHGLRTFFELKVIDIFAEGVAMGRDDC